ncbi:MAG: outer membrane receptor protein [Bdellovibrio sp. ArHS]|uniref:TonB-dependent receptor plug domain-containing protein n=1 Tax=Bdellovibrio sp. ArHS TaxID=1569284 RepID=UPI0005835C90|nr:TonB-dependent receptor [Bdellovibrio sp. ArHS]KHD87360.1 MAG: outer membrane receptor protein [Bdellovibrio sp. ArHS]
MKYSSLLLSLLMGLSAQAQESIPSFETVVEDVIFNTSNKIVIDEETIRESRAPNITTLLSSQANITVTSTPYQPNSIFIRGGDASHVMILVDGVPFYDASTIQRTFNLNSLDIKSVRRIEIIKGGQTVLYGGQALSGVIKIDTIPAEFKTKTGLQAQIGTQNFRDITAVHTEALDENNAFIMRGHGAWKDAESPVLGSAKTYIRNNWNAEGTYAWKGNIEGNIKAHFLQDLNASPASSRANNALYDTENFEQYTRQIGASSNLRFTQTPWEPRLAISTQNSLRSYDWPVLGPDNPSGTEDDYGANLRSVRLDFTPFKGDELTLTGGLSYIYEDFVYRKKGAEQINTLSEQRGLFLKADYVWNKNYSLALGGRVENWGDQDPVGTYQVGLTLFENTKLEATSGYKIPSLFQLYSSYGNPDLKAENANQYSLMQEWIISDIQNVSVTLFYSEFSNLLLITGTPGNFKYNNVAKSETRGVDVAYTIRPNTASSIVATYGYQEPRDFENDRWLLRRPLVNGSLRYIQGWDNKHSASLEFIAAGTRLDNGATDVISIPGYVTANAAYSYTVNDKLTLYTRLNNLADHRYEETYSYYSEGFNTSVGGEYWF